MSMEIFVLFNGKALIQALAQIRDLTLGGPTERGAQKQRLRQIHQIAVDALRQMGEAERASESDFAS